MKNMQELFEMDLDDLIKIAKKFKWNEDAMSNEWFTNMDKLKYQLGIEFDPKLLKSKPYLKPIVSKDCQICCDQFTNSGDSRPFALKCKHTFCISCWVNYLLEMMRHGVEGIDATCMQSDCNMRLGHSTFLSLLEGRYMTSFEEEKKEKNKGKKMK